MLRQLRSVSDSGMLGGVSLEDVCGSCDVFSLGRMMFELLLPDKAAVDAFPRFTSAKPHYKDVEVCAQPCRAVPCRAGRVSSLLSFAVVCCLCCRVLCCRVVS
jgi:hypothetical protein